MERNLNSTSEELQPDGIGEETQKFSLLTHIFFCKLIECIYTCRCPKDLSDLKDDGEKWFSINIQQSQSLREHMSGQKVFGWFLIEIRLTEPEVVIEKWYLAHKPNDLSVSRPIFAGTNKELRAHTYRLFTQVLRSVYSMLNVLPAKTLELYLNQMPSSNKRITASCSHYMSLPVNRETDDNIFKSIQFNPIMTPLGKCDIVCEYIHKLDEYIPKIISPTNTTTTYKRKASIEEYIEQISDDWVQLMPIPSEFLPNEFYQSLSNSSCTFEENVADTPLDPELPPIKSFICTLNRVNPEFEEEINIHEVKQRYQLIYEEVDQLLTDLNPIVP